MKPILEVKDVNVYLNSQHVLQDISFTVKAHDFLLIVGPNGGGKSTLLRALLGLIPFDGSITWAEEKIGYLPPQDRINKQYLPPLTVYDFFLLKGASDLEIKEHLQTVGLEPELLKHQFTGLSTGQSQRMLIAWCLVNNPSALVLDEPTASLDIAGEELIFSLFYKLWKEGGITIILVTHHLHLAWKYANTVLCLNKEMVCYGSTTTLTQEDIRKIYGESITYGHR